MSISRKIRADLGLSIGSPAPTSKAVAQRIVRALTESAGEAKLDPMLLFGGPSCSGLVHRSPNRVERNRRNLRLILLRLFGFAIAVLLSFRHGRSPSIQFGSREADMARSRRRERTRANKSATPLNRCSALVWPKHFLQRCFNAPPNLGLIAFALFFHSVSFLRSLCNGLVTMRGE
jgi:hypothetical protein